ncbi:hypothetical protein SeMB42_g02448 [Synchytrium endobioticum]|uniref:Enoyl-CoA hydratase n=1 Tax=Synchytrium endobioticum TaxID=286115 RepID=A0A507DDW0_9FUNG|nr:hypothetical protein SeLEV6574_g02663 [Synchytrium endobioticum]TPX49879.1 hypothetical protein SeMB42_g02448 [Synchytrium endobioticum]
MLRTLLPRSLAHSPSLPVPFRRSYSSSTTTADHDVIVHRDHSHGCTTGVVIVTLNNPRTLNALSESSGNYFRDLMHHLSADNTIRCMILTGQGRAFSVGGDLAFLRARTRTAPQANAEIMRNFYARYLSVRQVPFPTIAAINGPAVGAGFCLALACDIRLATMDAKMGLNFVRLGLTPGMAGTHTLPIVTNPQVAARMMLTGDLVTGAEAEKLGMILKATSPDALLPEALALARRIASASPVAVRATTKTIRMSLDDGIERALWREADTQAHAYAAADIVEGLDAIEAKRDPIFSDFNHVPRTSETP